MKKGIHPKNYYTQVVCGTCGSVWPVISTRENMRVDVCSNCHPFFTGEQRIVDTAGQVDRFMRRLRTSQDQQAEIARRRAEREKPEPKKRSLLKEIYGEDA
ncbi:MAG: 50S ribosomal protein L31 [Roseiflexaceae bacterium]|nr:50S ribosomal protein L31 [Roseiflexus sp.]MDW8212181.1 50S ribosomal protein L31 [Roseiflexaceae bacterium]